LIRIPRRRLPANPTSAHRVKSTRASTFTNGGYVEAKDYAGYQGDGVTPERLA
jgi:hypothetical protein